uniref:Putative glycosyl hydrolase family10 n=1 Tax=uncultured symbiotic protist of Cryptocercus punctulatus TaxID=403662 RepID=A4UX63_9EUKA|nr:putative glycosyl hydrolase family10 [uncultured symbiotic protist of Cryptocercus punctulatus]
MTILALVVLSFSAPIAQGKSKFLGNVIASTVPSNFGNYWNQVTPENGGKWGSVQSSQNSWNWNDADTAYNWAKSNGAQFKYHTLVWGSQEPNWIGGLSNDAKKQAVTAWIQAVASRFSGVNYIDVVNEALHAPASYREAIGGSGTTGWDWIVWAFTTAKPLFSGAKLLINEYGIINDQSEARKYIEIINIMKSRGLIDGIGIQCHQSNVNDLSAANAKTVLDLLTATGVPIYVSEFDANGNSAADQSTIYQRIFPALWEHSNVKGVTLWGYITGQTWKDGTGIVESNGQERAAMTWLKQYIASH